MLVDASRVLHQPVGPLRGKEIGLFEKVEELVLRPFRVAKRLSLGSGRRRAPVLAGHALHRAGPEIEVGAAEAGLQLYRALRIGQPIFGNAANCFDRIGQTLGEVAPYFSFLARL